ncbi:hypothetical protein D3C78_1082750 [compost metagenome]
MENSSNSILIQLIVMRTKQLLVGSKRIRQLNIQGKRRTLCSSSIKLGLAFLQGGIQLQRVHRLKQIIYRAKAKCVLRIMKIIIAAYDNRFHLRKSLIKRFKQPDSVHTGHAHVRNDDMRPQLRDKLQGIQSIISFTDDFHSEAFPLSKCSHDISCPALVIDEKHFNGLAHCSPPPASPESVP